MEAYTSFARVYDTFMDNIPYEEWCEYLTGLMREYGVRDGLVLDLGCGTGNMTELLAKAGYDMIGADNAEEMLEIAMEKRDKSGHDILYLLQDMREFELYGTVRAVISVCDSVNYITEPEELQEVFRLVNNYLDPKGVFIFDFEYHLKNLPDKPGVYMKRFLGIAQLRRTGRNAVLSGTTIITKMRRSMNMI